MHSLEIFKVLSDYTRLRLYKVLLETGASAAVCELMTAVQCAPYNVSKHLRILHLAGLIKERKSGRWVFYFVKKTEDKFIDGLNKAIKNLKDNIYKEDLRRFKLRLRMRKNGKIQFCVDNRLFNRDA